MNTLQNLDKCYKYYNRQLSEMFQNEGHNKITFNSYQYLITIYNLNKEGHLASTTEIAKKLAIRKSSVVNMVNTLLESGYLIKRASLVDKRSYSLELSEKGYQVMTLEASYSQGFLEFFYASLNQKQIKEFENSLNKIATYLVENLDKMDI